MKNASWAIALAGLLSAISARADGGHDPAALYEKGAAAQQRGDYADAARLFAKADALAPNPIALEAALRAGTTADSAVFAMELADRADARAKTKALAAAVAGAKSAFAD